MNKLRTILLTGVATLSMVSAARAEQVMTLSDADLDDVTAAGNSVSAELTGDGIVFGAFLIGNLPGVGSFSEVVAVIIPLSGVPTLKLTVSADSSY